MPTPRSKETTNDRIINNSTSNRKILNDTKVYSGPIKHSNSNTSITSNNGSKKPPIPISNSLTNKKSTSLVRHERDLQLSIAKAEKNSKNGFNDEMQKVQTPRISNLNRSASSTGKMLIASSTPMQKKKASVPTNENMAKNSIAQDNAYNMAKKKLITTNGSIPNESQLNRKNSLSPEKNDRYVSPQDHNKNIFSVSAQITANKHQTKKIDKNMKTNSTASPSAVRKNNSIRRSMLPQPMSVLRRPSKSPTTYISYFYRLFCSN